MKGTLIVNAFLKSAQTDETYAHLIETARRHAIDMDFKTNADYLYRVDNKEVYPCINKSDFILFWNKDIELGRVLESHGLRLFNPSKSIELCDDKMLTCEALAGIVRQPITIKIPMTFDTVGYNEFDFIEKLEDILGYPFIIKECWGSYGGQVYLADSREKAISILKGVDGTKCIAQEYIHVSRGRDLRAYVVGDRVVAAIERSNANDFRANITNGGSAKNYSISPMQEEMAVKATKALGLDFAGVDLLFLENDEPILCEVNSNAQFRGLISASGIDVTDAIFEHIQSVVS